MTNNSKYDVITFGSATIDVYAGTDAKYDKIPGSDKELLSYVTGSKILIKKLEFQIGGGGTNTATAFSRLGLNTAWLGKLGDDDNARKILEFLHDEKIDVLAKVGKGLSGYSIVLDSKGHDRTILTHKGENNHLSFSEIDKSNLEAKWFYFSSMMGKSFETQKKLARFARKNNINLAFNPSSYQAKLGYKKLLPILQNTTLIVLNLEESKLLLGRDPAKNFNIKMILEELVSKGPKMALVTNASKSAYCLKDGVIYEIIPHKNKIVETTGAGDAFASSFVAGLILKGDDEIEFALRLALANAESVVANHGAKNILLTLPKAKKVMKKKTIIKKCNL